MGYSLPAAIGAYYADRQKIVSFNGDGGFQMNMQELQFIVREKLPITIIIVNNHALGMIRHFRKCIFKPITIRQFLEKVIVLLTSQNWQMHIG